MFCNIVSFQFFKLLFNFFLDNEGTTKFSREDDIEEKEEEEGDDQVNDTVSSVPVVEDMVKQQDDKEHVEPEITPSLENIPSNETNLNNIDTADKLQDELINIENETSKAPLNDSSPPPNQIIHPPNRNSPPPRISPCASPTISPEHSLKVPMVTYTNMVDIKPIRYELSEEDKELERKFHNIVFAFNTDQFTLQKRLENQVLMVFL